VKPPRAGLPFGYAKFLEDVKSRIRTAQVKAALSVNRELIQLYWSIGGDIVERQRAEGWGAAVIDRLAADIQRELAGLAGFSRANIYRMRAFYLAYPQDPAIVSQAARRADASAPPEPMVSLPWFHNVVLLESLKDACQRLWYAKQTIANGWSRSVLVRWIESDAWKTTCVLAFSKERSPARDARRALRTSVYGCCYRVLRLRSQVAVPAPMPARSSAAGAGTVGAAPSS